MYVIANVECHIVVVDRVGYPPMIFGILPIQLFDVDKPSVGYFHHAGWHGYRNQHAVDLIGLMIFVWPPNTCSQPLAGSSDPWFAVAVLFPIDPPVPRCPGSRRGRAGVMHGKRVDLPLFY